MVDLYLVITLTAIWRAGYCGSQEWQLGDQLGGDCNSLGQGGLDEGVGDGVVKCWDSVDTAKQGCKDLLIDVECERGVNDSKDFGLSSQGN